MRPYDEQSISNRAPRRRFVLSAAIALSGIIGMLLAIPLHADPGDFTVFTDKQSYSAVLLPSVITQNRPYIIT